MMATVWLANFNLASLTRNKFYPNKVPSERCHLSKNRGMVKEMMGNLT